MSQTGFYSQGCALVVESAVDVSVMGIDPAAVKAWISE